MQGNIVARWLESLRGNVLWILGYTIVAINIVFAIAAPILVPYNPVLADVSEIREPPSLEHWFGTDTLGMDILSRTLYAPRVDLFIAFLGTAIALIVGCLLGVLAGYYSNLGTDLIMRASELTQAFPVFVFAMVLVALAGPDIRNIILAIAFVNAPMYLRLTRAEVLALREKPYIEAARCMGLSDYQILLRHVLPNAYTPALVQSSVNIGWGILLTAGLSFVGAGVSVPTPEWGSMINLGAQSMITGEWWISLFPGIVLGITVVGFALVADNIRFLLGRYRK